MTIRYKTHQTMSENAFVELARQSKMEINDPRFQEKIEGPPFSLVGGYDQLGSGQVFSTRPISALSLVLPLTPEFCSVPPCFILPKPSPFESSELTAKLSTSSSKMRPLTSSHLALLLPLPLPPPPLTPQPRHLTLLMMPALPGAELVLWSLVVGSLLRKVRPTSFRSSQL